MHEVFTEVEREEIRRAIDKTYRTIADDLEVGMGKPLHLKDAADYTIDADYLVVHGGLSKELYDRIVKEVSYKSILNFTKYILGAYF